MLQSRCATPANEGVAPPALDGSALEPAVRARRNHVAGAIPGAVPDRRAPRLTVHVAGDGPPVVLLHGLTSSHLEWVGLKSALAAGFTCLAWDARGHGEHAVALRPAMAGDGHGHAHGGGGTPAAAGWPEDHAAQMLDIDRNRCDLAAESQVETSDP